MLSEPVDVEDGVYMLLLGLILLCHVCPLFSILL